MIVSGVSGGYDFILSEHGGIRIDPTTVLGIRYVSGGDVVSLTSASGDKPEDVALRSGQSIAYKNANRRPCKVSLLSFAYEGKTASFAIGRSG